MCLGISLLLEYTMKLIYKSEDSLFFSFKDYFLPHFVYKKPLIANHTSFNSA